ncbi:unnamed protein product [Caenorhabditis auriculariae]|uniref:Uncharacterized protein n=1 Tax=Caenorhabditis auriculariae TaxID=2777116 RepID=A0A8S1HM79_9PELO|nr:unnamed protein product [Caenorhabditis auriculariae]
MLGATGTLLKGQERVVTICVNICCCWIDGESADVLISDLGVFLLTRSCRGSRGATVAPIIPFFIWLSAFFLHAARLIFHSYLLPSTAEALKVYLPTFSTNVGFATTETREKKFTKEDDNLLNEKEELLNDLTFHKHQVRVYSHMNQMVTEKLTKAEKRSEYLESLVHQLQMQLGSTVQEVKLNLDSDLVDEKEKPKPRNGLTANLEVAETHRSTPLGFSRKLSVEKVHSLYFPHKGPDIEETKVVMGACLNEIAIAADVVARQAAEVFCDMPLGSICGVTCKMQVHCENVPDPRL